MYVCHNIKRQHAIERKEEQTQSLHSHTRKQTHYISHTETEEVLQVRAAVVTLSSGLQSEMILVALMTADAFSTAYQKTETGDNVEHSIQRVLIYSLE